jgi:hypothetical protein
LDKDMQATNKKVWLSTAEVIDMLQE